MEKIKGGLSDNKTISQVAKKHSLNTPQKVSFLKKELENGVKVEMEHTDDEKVAKEIALDHLLEDPKYYQKLKKVEAKEMTGADSSGSFDAPAFGSVVKRKISKIPNMTEKKVNLKKQLTHLHQVHMTFHYLVHHLKVVKTL